ncbi:phosphopantetheine-binding protein [Streptomyces hundungensis]|uniref:phosphopantetheine-binding protein n=1 Tax=Streptomyces hundungensis TaxID=1077946 RepID=UPI0033DCA17C
MYDKIIALLAEMGVDTTDVTPDSTFRDLELDSLSMTELAINAFTHTGVLAEGLTLDTTLAEAVRAFSHAAEPLGA